MSEFQFRISRAAARIEAGDYDRAMREYEEISDSADSIVYKIETLCRMLDVELELGKFSAAHARASKLIRLFAAEETPVALVEASRMHFGLLQGKLAWATGDFECAALQLSRLKTSARLLAASDNQHLASVRAEIEIESANRALDRGEFDVGQKCLDVARKICGSDPALKLSSVDVLLAQINLNITRMRPAGVVSLQEQGQLANRAQELACQSGSMKRQLLVEILEVQLQKPLNDAVHEVARVLAIAKRFGNPRLVAMASMEFADYLLQGRHWREAGDLLCSGFPKGSYQWAILMHLKAAYQLRVGDPLSAYSSEKLAASVAQRAGNLRLHAATLRGIATAAYLLGREDEAADYIAAAVPIAERYGSLPSCRKTYQSAAYITGKQRYAREAEKLRLAVKV
jgi:hypothetical protein